jgi:hypothetical protein
MLFGFVLPGYEFTGDLDVMNPNGQDSATYVRHCPGDRSKALAEAGPKGPGALPSDSQSSRHER